MSGHSDELLRLAQQARREKRLSDAKRYLIDAVELSQKTGGRIELAQALAGLGQIERDLGRGVYALRKYEEAAAIYRAEGDMLRVAHTIRHLGDIHQDEGRAEMAEPCYREALALYRSHAHTPPLDLANAIRGLAILKDDAGEASEARRLWEEAKDLYEVVNVQAGVDESSRRLSLLDQR